MIIIGLILVFALFIIGEWIYTKSTENKNMKEETPVRAAAVAKERYYHPGHTWVDLYSDQKVEVGIDGFARKMIGRIERIKPV